jgi:hypothetical protein
MIRNLIGQFTLEDMAELSRIRTSSADPDEAADVRDRRLDPESDAFDEDTAEADEEAEQAQHLAPLDPHSLLRKLHSTHPDEQEDALVYMLERDDIPVTPEMSVTLGSLVTGSNYALRDLAASVISKAGASILHAELRDQIMSLLDNADGMSWDHGTVLVRQLGRAIDSRELRLKLNRLTWDEDPYARAGAAQAIGEIGRIQASPEMLAALARLLADDDRDVQLAAERAVATIGPPSAVTPISLGLSKLLADHSPPLRAAGAEAIEKLGPAAALPQVMRALTSALQDLVPDVARAAASAIGTLGAAVTPESVLALAALLLRSDEETRKAAAAAIIRLAAAGVSKIAARAKEEFKSLASCNCRMPHSAAGHFKPEEQAADTLAEVGWFASGRLAEGRIDYQIDRDRSTGAVELRFGSRDLELEHALLIVEAVGAPPKAEAAVGAMQASDQFLWLVLLKRFGDQLAGDVYITRAELPAEALFGIEWRIRLVEAA